MKLKKQYLLFSLLWLISHTGAYANNDLTIDGVEYFLVDWGVLYEDTAISYDETTRFEAEVEYSVDGVKRLFFLLTKDKSKICDLNYSEEEIWEFDGQAVRIDVICDEYSDSKNSYYSASPVTNAGANFVVNAFKNSPDFVYIKRKNVIFPFSAKGFTAVWNSKSKNAL